MRHCQDLCPFGPLFGDLVLGLLEEEEAQVLDHHLDDCRACRADLAEHLALWLAEDAPARLGQALAIQVRR